MQIQPMSAKANGSSSVPREFASELFLLEATAMKTATAPYFTSFSTPHHHYLYDAVTQRFLEIDSVIAGIVAEYMTNGETAACAKFKDTYTPAILQEAIAELKHAVDRGMLRSKEIRGFRPLGSERQIASQLQTHCSQLILEMTRNCNLDCGYCIYSGLHQNYPARSRRDMPEATLMKAIDFYIQHSVDEKARFISFYGGEPLLRRNVIEHAVAYAKQLSGETPLSFNITTNGTLLTEDAVEFLVANDFKITISLDGPKETHDRYRRFAKGTGTFERTMEAVQLIHRKHPAFYARNISFSAVCAPPVDYRALYEFFDAPLFRDSPIFVNRVSDPDGEFGKATGARPVGNENYDWLLEKYKQRVLRNQKPNTFLQSIVGRQLTLIHQRQLFERMPKTIHPNGVCLPGARRVFVDIDGTLHSCEKINANMPLGTVDRGFDVAAISRYLKKYQAISIGDCRSCWAVRICSLCFEPALSNDLSAENKRKYCGGIKQFYKGMFSLYCSIREQDDKALSFLADVKMG